MRILVISDLPQFVSGGAEMQAMRLIEAWIAQGHEVICLGRRMGAAPVNAGSRQIETHRIRTLNWLGRPGRALSYAWSLALLLVKLRRRFDVVYTRFLNEAAATTALLRQVGLIDAPLVATPATVRGDGDVRMLQALPFSHQIIDLLDRQCGAINLIADEMKDELLQAGFGGSNLTHIPNGIAVRPLNRREASGPVRFVAVGRLVSAKAYDVLLQSLASIRTQLHPGQFTIIGNGPDARALHDMTEALGLSEYVVWKGELDQPSIQRELSAADIYLLHSRYEGLSNAGLEAMERALPMIISRCGGLDLHVDAGMGWRVVPGDSASLAQAISGAMESTRDELHEKGLRCRRLIESKFDIEVTSARYTILFETLQGRERTFT
jgi:glycosyltransferase involved in cell wall biosynthesis